MPRERQREKNECIDRIVKDLKRIRPQAEGDRLYALDENVRFFEASRTWSSYVAWILFEMPNVDGTRLLELSDFDIPEWQTMLQKELMEIEQQKYPDILAQLRGELVKEVLAASSRLTRHLVLLGIGAGSMEVERQLVNELRHLKNTRPILFVIVDNSQASLDAGFKNIGRSGVHCIQRDGIGTSEIVSLRDGLSPGSYSVLGIRSDALALPKLFSGRPFDIAYYSKFKHHLPDALKNSFVGMVKKLSPCIVEGDDYRGFYLPFFSTITAWYKPVLLNGAVFSSLRDPTPSALRKNLEPDWKLSFRPAGGYVLTYHEPDPR